MRKKRIIVIILIFIVLCLVSFLLSYNKNELRTIRTEKELLNIYDNNDYYSYDNDLLKTIVTLPFSGIMGRYGYGGAVYDYDRYYWNSNMKGLETDDSWSSSWSAGNSSEKDYSKTNIQVENVDEADITKTDGDYIYSISDNNVIITNAKNPEDIKIEATITANNNTVPEDLILYKNKLVVISVKSNNSRSYSYYGYKEDTLVSIYDVTTKSSPVLVKSYEMYEGYYTSRCIDNKLYVISSGYLRKENDKIVRSYMEDNVKKDIELNDIKYLKDVKTRNQTLFSMVDLDNINKDIDISSYLIDISNAYVSENSIYLLDSKYSYDNEMSISCLFGLKGVFGLFDYENYYYTGDDITEIYKFNISGGKVEYSTKTEVDGTTINQYSLDEKDNHLRVALYDDEGSRIVIFNERLKQIGKSDYVAKGETMYSSRFMGDKVYLVTYRTMDPLFVIDLSNEANPKVLGELHIPGYSTYLHPYDENHIIGIGMETKEVINKDSNGKVISTTARVVGMKMALFDVTDVNKPIEMSQTVIGDSRTTSAILTNPKALLFSKEKQLIAIPVNNYDEDFAVDSSNEYSSVINSYINYDGNRKSEGYFVYKINLDEGFKLKGIINHEVEEKDDYIYRYYYNSKLLRGLYIDNNLYTVSESQIKVNNLDTLELVDEIKIK